MVRPIRTLDEGARRIGEGDLDQQIVVRTGDELEGAGRPVQPHDARSCASRTRASSARSRSARASCTNSLEQQTAISEILRVIIELADRRAAGARRGRRARRASVPTRRSRASLLIDGDGWCRWPGTGTADGSRRRRRRRRAAAIATSITGRAVVDRETVHYRGHRAAARRRVPGRDARTCCASDCRAVLAVPLMREGGAYGAIVLARRRAGLFAPDQVALVQTFARPGGDRDRQRAPVQRDARRRSSSRRRPREVLQVDLAARSPTRSRCSTRSSTSCERLFDGERRRHQPASATTAPCTWARITAPDRGQRRRRSSRCRWATTADRRARCCERSGARSRRRGRGAECPLSRDAPSALGHRHTAASSRRCCGKASGIGAIASAARTRGRSPTRRSRCCGPSPTRR